MNVHALRPRRSLLAFAATLSIALVVACGNDGDQRTAQLAPGMDRDSALKLLAAGEPGVAGGDATGDSLQNIWRRTQYLMAGRRIEILFYSKNNEKWRATDTVPEEGVIPVVLVDGKVIGVGRTVYDSVTNLYGIPKNKY
ncbi:MAG: hypothetical protein ABI877_16255 [Gemmatimonadaceae bacterium]